MTNLARGTVDRSKKTPAHRQVRDQILAWLSNDLTPGDKLPSEPEIAEMLGVSRMTANKALIALTHEGYLIRAKGRGTFVAHPPGVSLTECIVAVSGDASNMLEDYYLGALYWRVHASLTGLGMKVGFRQLTLDLGHPAPANCGLIAINPNRSSLDELLAYSRGGAPVVVLGASWSDCGMSTVDSDNLLGAGLAVNHLANLGHRRILFLGGLPEDSNTIDRVRGFRTAMKMRQLPLDERDVIVGPEALGFDMDIEERIFARIDDSDGPTAVFVGGPHLAIRLLAAAQRRGVRVPQDFSIVGYDDPSFMGLAHPGLTTVRQPLAEMAVSACDLLLRRIQTGDPRPERRFLDPDLVVRASTANPGGNSHKVNP